MRVPADAVVTGIGVVAPTPGDDPGTWFDVRTRLGARGYKYLPPASQYVLAAAREALDGGAALDAVPEDRRGTVLATNNGLAGTLDEMDRTVIEDGAGGLSPVRAPFFAINVLGSRLSADHGLKAFALTVTSPRVAGLEAVQSGLRAMAAGRCSALLVAAMEDGMPGRSPERGAVAVLFEPRSAAVARGARTRGTCRVRTMFAPPHLVGSRPAGASGAGDRLAAAIGAAVKDLAGDADPPVEFVHDGSEVADTVSGMVAGAAGGEPTRIAAGNGCLTPMLRLSGVLARTSGDRLVVTASGEGNIALARVQGSESC